MTLTRKDRYLILASAFLGWMFAGVEMSLMIPATRPAIQEFLATPEVVEGGIQLQSERVEVSADQWLSWYITAFFLGAALGGALFGWVGDRAGRVKAMGLSILCYSIITGLSYFASGPRELLLLRFLASAGIGGMWPTGVSLVSEAWPTVSRPILAGLIGTSANVGFLILGIVMLVHPITRESWRWVFLFGATPALLGVLVLISVPESPIWLAGRGESAPKPGPSPITEVFRPPLLRLTLLGIGLGTIPLLGGWASGQRLIPWAGQAGEIEGLPHLKAATQVLWATGAVLGSLAGGWLASRLGRRLSYFLISAGSLAISIYIFWFLTPSDVEFLPVAFALGLVATVFFGWLPYFLPELFPTRVRATGAGVSFNFGRILSAMAVLSSTALSELFGGSIAKMGGTTCMVYALGLVLAFVIPKRRELVNHDSNIPP